MSARFPQFNYSWDIARRDLVAGATVATIAIPQAMAYALIAGVDPRFGLYSAIVVTVVASILGSSNHLINGPTNAISLVVFAALTSFDERFDSYQALFLLALLVGAIQILIAVFKLGDLTRYVSESVILGFMAGAGILVAVGQVGNFLGAAKKGTGDQSALVQLWETLTKGGPFNSHAIGLGVGTIVVVLLLRRLINKYKLPQMDMLLGLIVAAGIAAYFGWSIPAANGKSVVSVVGKIPAALPLFHIPEINFHWITKLIGSAFAISFLGLLEALAVAKSIATYTRQPLDYNRQCLAEGVSNLVGGFFQSLPGSGSLTRSSINYQAGAITRLSGIYSGAIVAAVVLLFGPYARFIPKPALAGLLFITAARLIDWRRLGYAVRASRFDAILVFITAFSAIFISVDESILIGVGLSIIMFVPRASKLGIRELVVTGERVVRERQPEDPPAESLLIYDLEGELFFGGAPELEHHFEKIKEETIRTSINYVVLRLRRARNPDVVAIEHLEHFLRDAAKRGVTILLAGVRPDLAKILSNSHFQDWLPADRIFPEEDKKYSATLNAVRHACHLLARHGAGLEPDPEKEEAVYYLV
ncbi:MAG: SulP family inorganic anion transporter [Chthoniobacteraceae bacterium]